MGKRRNRRRRKRKSVDSKGKPLLKNRELTKPPMVEPSKKKYNRKKNKKVELD